MIARGLAAAHRRWPCANVLGLALFLGGCLFHVPGPPSEATFVRIVDVPEGTTYVFLVQESESGVAEVREWHQAEFSWYLESHRGVYDREIWHGSYERHVPWPRRAARIGVVAGTRERRWQAFWFPWRAPHDGLIEFDLARCTNVESISDGKLEQMDVWTGLTQREVKRLAPGQRWVPDDIADLSKICDTAEEHLRRAANSINSGSLQEALSDVVELMAFLDDRCRWDRWPEPEASTLEEIFASFARIRDSVDKRDAVAADQAVAEMAEHFRRLFATP